jgi:MFS family permease
MIVPVLPLFLNITLSAPAAAIGVVEGIAESTASVLRVFAGWLSDRAGRRKPLVVAGYSLSNLTKPLLALAGSWPQVLFVQFADRVGKGIRGAPRDALIADSIPTERRGLAFGYQRTMDTFGAALGPLVAFAILARQPDHYRTVFWASAVPGVVFALVDLGFALTRGPRAPAAVVALFLVYGVYYALTDGIQRALVVDLVPAGLRATALGTFSTATGAALLPASLAAGVLWDRIDPAAPFFYGAAMAVLAAFLLAVVTLHPRTYRA